MRKQHVKLTETERHDLEDLIGKGQHSARLYKRAVGLLALDRGETCQSVAEMVGVTHQVVSTWAKNYRENGLRCLEDQPRSGRPIEIDGLARAKITALACSDPPEGYGQWSLRLLADKAVELEYCEHISHNAVKDILKKMPSNPI